MNNLLITQDRPGARRKTVRKLYLGSQVREKLRSWQSTTLLSFSEELEDFLGMCRGQENLRIADGLAGLRAIESRGGRQTEAPAPALRFSSNLSGA